MNITHLKMENLVYIKNMKLLESGKKHWVLVHVDGSGSDVVHLSFSKETDFEKNWHKTYQEAEMVILEQKKKDYERYLSHLLDNERPSGANKLAILKDSYEESKSIDFKLKGFFDKTRVVDMDFINAVYFTVANHYNNK